MAGNPFMKVSRRFRLDLIDIIKRAG